MSKLNRDLARRLASLTRRSQDTINRAGGLAYQDTPRMALYRQAATSLWSGDGYLASQDNSCQFAPGQPVVELAGWSESIFEFIAAMEVGESIVQHIIEKY